MRRFKLISLGSALALALALFPSTTGAFAEEVSNPSSHSEVISEHLGDNQSFPMTSGSGKASFGKGVSLTANAWIQTLSNWSGCGQFKTSAVMNRSPQWIRNTTSFYQIGIGSLSIKGVNIQSSRSGGNTLVWTNNNGAKGSYLSGSVCGGWGAIYLGMDVTGTAFYNGTTRVASAHI